MAVFSCKEFSRCKDPASPIENLTAEASDGPTFIGLNFPWIDPNNPNGGNGGDNLDPPTYFAGGCFTICESQVSQQEADLCAQRAAFICSRGGGGDGNDPGPPAPSFFYNNLQVCNISCGDGTTFSYLVFPGTFVDTSQAAADERAGAYACEQGAIALICLNSISNGCFGQTYSATIQTSAGGGRSFIFTVVAGTLPPGLELTQTGINTAVISGTPTMNGSFAFTVRATESNGNFMEKTYSVAILQVTNSPSDAPVGSTYNFTFTIAGGTAPYTFELSGGTLPEGLTLSSDGTISGTPTTAESDNFTFAVVDAAGNFCEFDSTITTTDNCTCTLDWTAGIGNCRLRIVGYVDGVLTPCLGATPSGLPGWDGTLSISAPPLLLADAAGHSISGHLFFGASNTPVGLHWTLSIAGDVGGVGSAMWNGILNSTCPIGVYTRTSGCQPGPATLTLEAYSL